MDYHRQSTEMIRIFLKEERLSTEGDHRAMADRLCAYYRGKERDGFDVMFCDICGGWSIDTLDCCPFCGDGGKHSPAPVFEKELDKAVYSETDLNNLLTSMKLHTIDSSRMWHVGEILWKIRKEGLWRLRRKDPVEGKNRRYETFSEWLKAETPFENKTASRLIRLVECMSRSQWDRLFPNLLSIANHRCLPPDDRGGDKGPLPPIRRDEHEGVIIEVAPTIDSEEGVGVLEDEDGKKTRVKLPKELVQRPRRGFRIKEDKVGETVRLQYGSERIPMKRRTGDAPATDPSDDPWCEFDLTPNTSIVIKVVKRMDGRLDAIWQVKKKHR